MSPSQLNPYLHISPEVVQAQKNNVPVVALESTIISHGMPYPKNVHTAQQVEQVIRDLGAMPATIAILEGSLRVGLALEEIIYLGRRGKEVTKSSRRDIPFLVAAQKDGATTVAATMAIAAMANIQVFATGGIGGVHRGVEQTMDVSADLEELAQTNVAVVCAGVKSILDIPRTLEYLETHGVPVVGYQTSNMPAFYTPTSSSNVNYRVDHPRHIARAMHAKWHMGLGGGLVVANPVPQEHALDQLEIDGVIEQAIAEMNKNNIIGKDTTPYLLSRIAEQTEGRSLATNIELVLNNARLAAQIATEYAELQHNSNPN